MKTPFNNPKKRSWSRWVTRILVASFPALMQFWCIRELLGENGGPDYFF